MAPGKNGYRVVMPVFDARERRLARRRRWHGPVGWAVSAVAGLLITLAIFNVF